MSVCAKKQRKEKKKKRRSAPEVGLTASPPRRRQKGSLSPGSASKPLHGLLLTSNAVTTKIRLV